MLEYYQFEEKVVRPGETITFSSPIREKPNTKKITVCLENDIEYQITVDEIYTSEESDDQ